MKRENQKNEARDLLKYLEEIEPTNKKQHREILPPDWELAKHRYENGHPKGEYCGVAPLQNNFSWRRGFQYCFTGFPNFGKTTMTLFLMLAMSKFNGWKWLIWSPEMLDSHNKELTANDIYDELAHTLTGKNPDKRYNNQPTLKEYKQAYDFIKEHFMVIQPEKKSIDGMLEALDRIDQVFAFDGYLGDPFKSLEHPTNDRWDLYLEKSFAKINDYIKEMSKVWAWVAHPNSSENPLIRDRSGDITGTKVCNQFMLSGGSAWNNSMDVICSVHKPNYHLGFQDNSVEFHALKIRKQNQVGRTGVIDNITFDIKTNRYYFDGYDCFN